MIGNLPRKFIEKMEKLLGTEFDNFMSSYDAPRVYGLRINRLKLNVQQWKELSSKSGEARPVPWAEDGLYYNEGERPGKHPHYHAGLYYIQEPSAMAPVELLDVQPGHRVLDLCAAPGGKSTQIAAKLQGSGVLVTNDNAKERTKALAKNIELAGVRNAVVLNEEPAALAPVFTEWFDRILVDAPCSGEGMFRKDETMIADWEKHSVERCSVMQRDILNHAAAMLSPGGLIVYSTCTFSPEENEQQIAAFLAQHEDFIVEAVPHRFGWAAGRADLAGENVQLDAKRQQSINGTLRLWPHRIEGEGHYAAVLKRAGKTLTITVNNKADNGEGKVSGADFPEAHLPIRSKTKAVNEGTNRLRGGILKRNGDNREKYSNDRRSSKQQAAGGRDSSFRSAPEDANPIELWRLSAEQFASGALNWPGKLIAYGSRVYIQPADMPPLDGLRVVRAGWYVGEAGRGRMEPSHPLAMGLTRGEAIRSVNWSSAETQTLRFLKGETIFVEESEIIVQEGATNKGYVLVCTDGYPIGWGKYAGGMIKNELPAGWRWM
ncbi:RsmB/NOP family class I SAM-dependent RNA methyltransferase [Paenibacillus prosopidis]|uniref:NOL1/NOP2/sun family putative RNA methylase n=1 Tax=Paenibacillus prosopidis TaxID=630520 RepID=A0A368VWL5_9BACL|nr:RsmB/NOP family class I SAM-dependent RNA methyltransferase [Paenibacillus prosopidis]RCW45647.1 NOL1/NOP2/sun family putative RNA methylase [Paenibacillus prosopidis]